MSDIMLDQALNGELMSVEESADTLKFVKSLPGPHMRSLPASVALDGALDRVWEILKQYQQLINKDVEEMQSFVNEMNQLDNS